MAQTKKDTTPTKTPKKSAHGAIKEHTPAKQPSGQAQLDIAGLNLGPKEEDSELVEEEPPKAAIALDRLLEQVKAELEAQEKAEKRGLSLVVIGTVSRFKVLNHKLMVPRACGCRKIDAHGEAPV